MSDQPDDRQKSGLDHPKAVDILTTEHWSLLSTRSVGYEEMFGRTTLFVAVLSGFVIALALLAQATRFGCATLLVALLLISIALFIGISTFVRCVAINLEDARCLAGMDLLRSAYLKVVPELQAFFIARNDELAHGSRQRMAHLGRSLTTTSSVVATLNSVLAGSLAADLGALLAAAPAVETMLGIAVSLLSGIIHVGYAARFREKHAPSG